MDGCSNLFGDDVVDMRSKINDMTEKTYDSSYQKKLLDPLITTRIDYSGQIIDVSDFRAIKDCTKLTYLDLSNVKLIKNPSESIDDDEDTVEKLMKKVFKNLSELKALGLKNFTINFGSGPEKISELNFLQDESSNLSIKNLVVLDLQGTDVHAGLNIDTDLVSKNNAGILNNLTKLRLIVVDNPYFDFSNLQVMLDRFGGAIGFACDFVVSDNARGIICLNNTSMETLEKCTSMRNFVSFSYFGEVTVDLDLSACTSCSWIYIYNLGGRIKLPKSVQSITNTINYNMTFDFSDRDYQIDYLYFNEGDFGVVERTVPNLIKNNITVNKFGASHKSDTDNLNYFLDENGECNWITDLTIGRKSYDTNLWESQEVFRALESFSSTSIQNLSLRYCGMTDLSFIQNFKNLKKLSIDSSKIVDISGLEPRNDGDGNHLSGFSELEEFTLINPVVNSITDITVLGRLQNLKRLNVSGTKINKGIEALAGLNNLEYVNLTNCSSLSQNRKLC